MPEPSRRHRLSGEAAVCTGVLLATALFFGVFFIYPLIRTQVKEEGKLRAMTSRSAPARETLEHAALTDGLTGMQNRRYFDDALKEYLEEFRRIDKPVGLMILDLDHFKQVNDTHGHDVGDEVLRAVAGCLKDMTRYHDVVARLGGEEFAVVAPNMDTELLMQVRRAHPQGDRRHGDRVGQCAAEDHHQRRPRRLGPQGERRGVLPPRRPAALPGQDGWAVTASAPETLVQMLAATRLLRFRCSRTQCRSAAMLEHRRRRLSLTT